MLKEFVKAFQKATSYSYTVDKPKRTKTIQMDFHTPAQRKMNMLQMEAERRKIQEDEDKAIRKRLKGAKFIVPKGQKFKPVPYKKGDVVD